MAVMVGILAECIFLAAVLPPVAMLPVLAVIAIPIVDPTLQPSMVSFAAFVLGCMLAFPVLLIKHKG